MRKAAARLCAAAAAAAALAACGGAAPAVTAPPGFASVQLSVPAKNHSGAFSTPHRLTVPRGWRAEVWALLPDARLAAWTPAGSLLVSSPSSGDVYELTPGSNREQPPSKRVVLSGLKLPQGLAFDRIGGHEVLYVAETDQIDRYIWLGNHVGARTILIPNLPSGDDHDRKNVVVNAKHDVFVRHRQHVERVAATSVESALGLRHGIRTQRQADSRLGPGVRNGDGLSFAPDGSLWSAVNERDNIAYPFHKPYGGKADAYGQVIQAYVNNHPPDEVAELTPGRNLGWPYCNPDPDKRRGSATTGFDYANMPFDDDAQTNGNGSALNCAALTPINRGLPAHSAPLGFHFLEGSKLPAHWAAGAVVAVHGSWDRHPPRPPAVLWMPWEPS